MKCRPVSPPDRVSSLLGADGRFPNHPADPLQAQNLRDVQAAVRRTGADFGVAFDGANMWVANYGSNNVTKLPLQ